MIDTVGVLGGGAWGTALALVALRAGRSVTLWARDPDTVAPLATGENPRHLPGLRFEPIAATTDMATALNADAVILAVPAQAIRGIVTLAEPHLAPGTPLIVSAKGIERGTAKRMSEVVVESAPAAMPAILSGPSFAADVARGLPTAVTIAAADETLAMALCQALGSASFRPYAETDLIGVEIGGAVKNVLAIAAGIVAGRNLGASALAALVARGFAELRRLGETLGARPETLMGLSGLGDLMLTASSAQSRNFAYGREVGMSTGGLPMPATTVEGIETAFVTRDLARRLGVAMPIVEAVAAVLAKEMAVDAAIEGLMARPIRREAG